MTIPLSDSTPDFRHNKRRKIDTATVTTTTSNSRWKSTAEQQTYSSKLISALRHVHNRHSTPSLVRAAADTTLAAAAKGRSRWSRAILTNRAKRLLKNHRKSKIRPRIPPTPPLPLPPYTAAEAAGVEKRVRMLGKLVPGCKKISFPKLLEETSDYIAALQMQVRAMSELARLLSGSTEPESNSSVIIDDDNPAH